MENIAMSSPADFGLDETWGMDLGDFAKPPPTSCKRDASNRRRSLSLPKKRARIQLSRFFGWYGGGSEAAAACEQTVSVGVMAGSTQTPPKAKACRKAATATTFKKQTPMSEVLLEVEELEHELASTKVKLASVSTTVDALQQKELKLKRKVQEALVYSHALELQLVEAKLRNFRLQEKLQDYKDNRAPGAANRCNFAKGIQSSFGSTGEMHECLTAVAPPAIEPRERSLRRTQSAG